jgi:hypothetical protein
MAYVNQDSGGWTELRVHGVSGTTPEALLEHPHTARVDGRKEAGFHRRSWEAPASAQANGDDADERLEAYCWGGLTAGSAQRALWLILAPFMLVNVAYWAVPYTAPGNGEPWRRRAVRRTAEAAQRLFALSITLALVAAFVTASMSFVGWQCADPTDTCAAKYSWLSFLSWSWLDLPGRRLVVTALLPLLVIGLLWWLANKSWAESERVPVPQAEGEHSTPLESRAMWNGSRPVRRLRAVHIAAGFAFVAVFLLTPFSDEQARGRGTGPLVLLYVVAAVLALTAGLACLPRMSDRDVPGQEPPSRRARITEKWVYPLVPWLPWATLLLVAVAGVVAWEQDVDRTRLVGDPYRTNLPGLTGTVVALAAVQILTWAAVVVLIGIMLRFRRPPGEPLTGCGRGTPVTGSPAWRGLATAALTLLGSGLASAYAAGVVLAVAHGLGRPGAGSRSDEAFVVPMAYFWIATLALAAAAAALLLLLWGLKQRGDVSAAAEEVRATYPLEGIDTAGAADPVGLRARLIARQWTEATVAEIGQRLLGWFVVVVALLILVAAVGFEIDQDWTYQHARWAVNAGDLTVAGFALALLYLGRKAYSNPRLRRTVGVLWDVGTFWPRATHPLAPPSYGERAVPDLVHRIDRLGRQGRVLLSCHSQGTVIGAAVLMQLTYAQSARVALLTYGSPLHRLYARFFPAYFGGDVLRRIGGLLVGDPDDTARRAWPWRNLYRLSDPIGGPVLVRYPATEISDEDWRTVPGVGDNDDVDRPLVDPRFAWSDGQFGTPPTYGHSGYAFDRAYRACVLLLRVLRVPGDGAPGGVPAPSTATTPPPPQPVAPVPRQGVPPGGRSVPPDADATSVPGCQPSPVHPWDEQTV